MRGITFFMDSRKITIAIPTYNRVEWTLRAFEQVLYDDRVGEVVIVDDFSNIDDYAKLMDCVEGMDKVHLFRNDKNLGCYLNKRRAIELSGNEYCILLDSDNIIDVKFINRLYDYIWNPSDILAPDTGEPSLNYKAFSGMVLTKENISELLHVGNMSMALNTCNYFVNRKRYLLIFDDSVNPWTSDSIFFNYLWLKAGNRITIVDGLSYKHTIHAESHYCLHNTKAPGFYESVIQKIKELK